MAKSSMSSEDASQTQHAECSPNNAIADKSTKLKKLEDWTKEDVRHWLMDIIKVPQQYTDILYKEDVYGAALILFDKKDFLDAGLKHGPAVQILKNMSQYKTSSDVLKNSAIPTAEIPTDGSNDHEITPKLSIQEILSSVQQRSLPLEETPKYTENEGKTLHDTSRFQEEQDDLQYKAGGTSSAVTETKENLTTFASETRTNKIDDWTKEDVRHWLMDVIKVPQQYSDILYNEDVYGAALILFDKKDFLAFLKHGPAVQILKNMLQCKTSYDVLNNSDKPTDTASLGEPTTARRPTNGSNGPKIFPELSIQENKDGITNVQQWSLPTDDTPKYAVDEGKFLHDTPSFQEEKDKKEGGVRCTQSTKLPHSTNPENSLNSLKGAVIRLCMPRPFDESCPTFEYTQNEILPPETGPSNLIDPVHEYKLMANTENASEEDVLTKFTDEVFWFAAGSMNTRTNGTIHFGVGDEPLYTHGQIIGISVTSLNKYIDAFYKCLKVHFTNHTSIVMRCIRPPKFFKVKCPDNIDVDKWVIEVDVVPMYDLTGEKLFYTTKDKKRRNSKCLFFRDGASTTNYAPEKGPKKEKQTEKNLKNHVKLWALSRKLAEERYSKVQARLIGDEPGGNPCHLPSSAQLSGSTSYALVPS
ncbi:sterile alpha motif domain-containing protein 9-like isoform X2 [Triplophysa rosa]|nr:sterile alpha motif domain-containing protein 9-like isoform X2 [Triplophysa rosa]XP_057186667.1 sterile alpha motif domain-containing protein 9-like isoform X2 [Triplophysa rosa]